MKQVTNAGLLNYPQITGKTTFNLILSRLSHSLHMNLYESSLKTPASQGKPGVARFIKVRHGVLSEHGHRDLQTEERGETKHWIRLDKSHTREYLEQTATSKKSPTLRSDHTCPFATQFIFDIICLVSKEFDDFVFVVLNYGFTL